MINDLTTPLNAKLFIQDQAQVIWNLLTVIEDKVPVEHKYLFDILMQCYDISKNQKAEIAKLQAKIEELEAENEQLENKLIQIDRLG